MKEQEYPNDGHELTMQARRGTARAYQDSAAAVGAEYIVEKTGGKKERGMVYFKVIFTDPAQEQSFFQELPIRRNGKKK
jgi:hypothetical protein